MVKWGIGIVKRTIIVQIQAVGRQGAVPEVVMLYGLSHCTQRWSKEIGQFRKHRTHTRLEPVSLTKININMSRTSTSNVEDLRVGK